MDGDLFSSNYDYERLKLSTSDIFVLSTIAINKKRTCKQKTGDFYEAFNDGKLFKAQEGGPMFCSTLNGKLASLPETYEDFMTLIDYKRSFMFHNDIWGMTASVNAKSISVLPDKPDIGYPPNGYFDNIYELGTERKLNLDDRVKKSISKDFHSYQSKEDLCYIMTTFKDGYPPRGFDAEHSWFFTQRCDRICTGCGAWWVVCKFKRKIFLKVSGLCTFSPMDKIFTLMDPDPDKYSPYERFGTFSGLEPLQLLFILTSYHYHYLSLTLLSITITYR